MIKRINSYTRR